MTRPGHCLTTPFSRGELTAGTPTLVIYRPRPADRGECRPRARAPARVAADRVLSAIPCASPAASSRRRSVWTGGWEEGRCWSSPARHARHGGGARRNWRWRLPPGGFRSRTKPSTHPGNRDSHPSGEAGGTEARGAMVLRQKDGGRCWCSGAIAQLCGPPARTASLAPCR